MKYCPHVEVLFKKKHEAGLNFENLEKLFKLIIELIHFGKATLVVENEENTNKTVKLFKCEKCENCESTTTHTTTTNRLHICAHCLSVNCFNHIEQHSKLNSHYLTIEICYAAIYCHLCKDFQYNQVLEEFLRELFLKESFSPFGI